jgi:hypothetical protein
MKLINGGVKELLPSDAPVPRGKEVDLRLFVYYDHTDEQFIRPSITGCVIYLNIYFNMAPNMWFSKHQPTVESSMFGAYFVVIKNGIETCVGIPYKLKMMGVPFSVSTYVYGDNTQRPESVLKNKSKSICYHAVSQSVVMEDSIIGHVPSVENPTYSFTKVVPGGHKRHHLIHILLHDLCD